MEKIYKLKSFLDANGIENQIEETQMYEDDESSRYLVFKFPVAREFDEIRIYEDDEGIDNIIDSSIFKYRGISNYEAIWSKEFSCIECEVNVLNFNLSNRHILRRLSGYLGLDLSKEEVDKLLSLELYCSDKLKVSIGCSSEEFYLLSTCKDRGFFSFDRDKRRFRTTLKIENIDINTQDEAKKILEKVSNTLFYQLELLYDFLIMLSPRRETRRVRRQKEKGLYTRREVVKRNIELNYEYDEIPMALYWFAQGSAYSPIFRYFALYQVIEYYFPIYATKNVKTKIQNLLKDPQFDENRDSDVLRLLKIVSTNSNGNIGDEREQLNGTLRNVVSGEDIIEFVSGNSYLQDYYKGKNCQRLSEHRLRLNDKTGIIDDVAVRIYDIRCKIVHNKATEIDNKILPMTKDMEYLINEVKLLEYIARKVIISNSRPFSL